jgi:hypothetical protein
MLVWSAPDLVPSPQGDVYSLGRCFLFFLAQVIRAKLSSTKPWVYCLKKSLQNNKEGEATVAALLDILGEMTQKDASKRPPIAVVIKSLESFL